MDFRQKKDQGLSVNSAALSQVVTDKQFAVRRPRHAGLFEAVHRLDVEMDAVSRRELADWIAEQYEKDYGDVPLGFIGPCFLGPPYVDHRIDLGHSIVEHYTPGDAVPEPFTAARMPLRLGGYEFIEVYGSGKLVAVRADGSAVVS